MKGSRRQFLRTGAAVAAGLAAGVRSKAKQKGATRAGFSGKRLGTVFNSDINNILVASSGKDVTPEEYQRAVFAILDMQPGLLAQNVGMPEAVIYRTSVATTFDKYLEEVSLLTWPESKGTPYAARQSQALKTLFALATDPLTLTIEACRKRGIPVVASYRMNAEDWYKNQYLLSDFERSHPEWRIPGRGCLDPAVPEVYEHRMKIFTEVAERYDIDGIEFDFRRWYYMVSDPLKNHTVLTRMVRETRKMLDETARKKGRQKLILGARVGPSLDTDPSPFVYPGIGHSEKPVNASCKDLGLDVKTWIAEGLVDYLCPALFLDGLPSLPKTREFAALVKKTAVGIYPTLWPFAAWQYMGCDEKKFRTITLEAKDQRLLALYKNELCTGALRIYEDGADGISTFNWMAHLRNARMPDIWTDTAGGRTGSGAVETHIYPLLKDPVALRRYREDPWAVPPKGVGSAEKEKH